MLMGKTRSKQLHQLALDDIGTRSRAIDKGIDKIWGSAKHAPMFHKVGERKYKDEEGNECTKTTNRATRLIGTHAWKIAVAGATNMVTRDQKLMAADFGLPYFETKENMIGNAMLSLSPGAKLLLEQVLCAYVQEVVLAARAGQKALEPKRDPDLPAKRLNKVAMRIAFEGVNKGVFGNAGMGARSTLEVLLKKKTAKTKGKETEQETEDPEAAAVQPEAERDMEELDAEEE